MIYTFINFNFNFNFLFFCNQKMQINIKKMSQQCIIVIFVIYTFMNFYFLL